MNKNIENKKLKTDKIKKKRKTTTKEKKKKERQ